MKKTLILVGLAAAVIFLSWFFIFIKGRNTWSNYSSHGGIYSGFHKWQSYLIYGTNYSTLYRVNIKNSEDVKTIDMNTGSVVVQGINGNYVYAISRDTLYKVNLRKMNVVWSFSGEKNFDLDRSEIHGNKIFLSDRSGSFYVLDSVTGKQKWKYAGENLPNISGRILDDILFASPDFWVRDGRVYLEGRGGKFTVLKGSNGKVVWEKDFKEPLISNITIYKNSVVLFTKSGKRLSLSKKTGSVLWEKSPGTQVLCASIYRRNFINTHMVAVDNNGSLEAFSIKNGEPIWKSDTFGPGINCPYVFTKSGMYTHSSGKILKIDMKTGKTKWHKDGFQKILLPPVTLDSLFGERYLIADLNGNVTSIGSNQKTYWTYKTGYPIYSPLMVLGKELVIGTSNGSVHKINAASGKPGVRKILPAFKVTVDSNFVDGNNIFEITLHSRSVFDNPWSQASLEAVFTAESGREIKVPGFYYDGTDWKIRFNPPEKGKWKYVLSWNDHGALREYSGNIESVSDTKNYYLRTQAENPKRVTLDGKNIFNGVGIQETMLDYNRNGTPLDDWTTGISEGVLSTSSAGFVSYFKSDRPVSLDEFISTYGPKGAGFNIYRYSLMNSNNPLYRNLETPTIFSIQEGKVADTLIKSLRANGIHTWITFFNFDVPFKNSLTPIEKEQLRSYIRYIIARYGAYTDIWELVNEMTIAPTPRQFLVDTIKNEDFENRLISTSFEDPEAPGIDIISPHWYESEELNKSDIKTASYIDSFSKYKKPVIFGEQGNGSVNWDTSSAMRMRVRLWTAFFKEGILIFWNVSDKKGIPQVKPFYANIYLGEEERGYVKHLQKFTSGFPLTSRPENLSVGNNVRGYALLNDRITAGYLYHFADQKSSVSVKVNLKNEKGGEVEWYEPQSGKTIKKDYCSEAGCVLNSPPFTVDIAYKLTVN